LPEENGQPAESIRIPPWLRPGLRVRLNMPDNPRVHNAVGVVAEITAYGGRVRTKAAGSGEIRAFPSEMVPASLATGDVCDRCGGSNMTRSGTCVLCLDCGSTSGGCS
jgi:hypothetical protein